MDSIWGTNDLALATFIVLCGEPLVGFHWFYDEKHWDGTCFMLFKDSWAVRHLTQVYMNGEAEVNAAVFALKFGTVKRGMLISKRDRHRSPLLLAAS